MASVGGLGVDSVIALARAVQGIDDATLFAPPGLDALTHAIPRDIISYNETLPARGRAWVVVHPAGAIDAGDTALFARLPGQNPLSAHYARTGDGRALRISDFVGSGTFHRLELYQAFYRPLGIEHQLAVTIAARRHAVIEIALNRRSAISRTLSVAS